MSAVETIAGAINSMVDRFSPTRRSPASTPRKYAKGTGVSSDTIPDYRDNVEFKAPKNRGLLVSSHAIKIENEKIQADLVGVNKPSAPKEDARKNGELHGLAAPDSSWSKESTDYDYDLSDDRELVVKIVNRKDRSEVIRQYPSKAELAYKTAFRKFMELIGL